MRLFCQERHQFFTRLRARARNVDTVITFDDQSTRTTYLHPYTYLIMPGNALPRTYGEKGNT